MSRRRGVDRTSELDVRHLRAFVALVDERTATAAARALGVAQSTVSEALAALERRVGAAVLTRRAGAREGALTPAGRALLPHARGILASVEAAHAAVLEASRQAKAAVHVIANESISTYLLPAPLGTLRERWPGTRFAVSVGTCSGVRDGVAKGRFDVGLLLGVAAREVRAPHGRLVALSLGSAPLVLFCRPDHPLASRPLHAAVPTRALAAHPIFLSDASGDFQALLSEHFGGGAPPGPRLESTGSVEGVKESVASSSTALGVLPAFAVSREVRAGRLRPLAIRPAFPPVRLDALLPDAAPALPAVGELLETLRLALAPRADQSASTRVKTSGSNFR